MLWKDNFEEGKELTISTCSKDGKPNACIAVSMGFDGDLLLIANVSMKTTVKNLNENGIITIISGYCRIKGTTQIFSKGNYFDVCTSILSRQDKSLKLKSAIVVKIKEVFDMKNIKPIIS